MPIQFVNSNIAIGKSGFGVLLLSLMNDTDIEARLQKRMKLTHYNYVTAVIVSVSNRNFGHPEVT